MATDNNIDNGTQTIEPADEMADQAVVEDSIDTEPVMTEDTQDIPAAEVPEVKTRKELKKERKEIKKHKKEVKKEAKRHSAKRTKAQNFWLVVITIFVIITMIVCGSYAVKSYKNIINGPSGGTAATQPAAPAGQSSSGSSTGSGSANGGTAGTPSGTPSGTENTTAAPSGDSGAAAAPAGEADLSTKEGIVNYYKAAHAKALSSAKSVTRTYDNTVNYNSVLEIGGNSTLEKVAKSLMGQFMKENTEATPFSGSDIAANFPPSSGSTDGLTADMISDATCTENGNNYIVKLTINSTEESFDLGDKTKNLCNIVDEAQVTSAAGSAVTLAGLENHYVGANITATIDKATGNLIALETDVPSYMCFAQAKVLIVSVNDCRIGLEYMQKWTVEY